MSAPTVVILAAGQGTRMRSRTPKVLHDLCGRPLVAWPVAAAREAGASKVIVVDSPERVLEGHLPEGVEIAVQPEPDGTAGALAAAAGLVEPGEPVVVLSGDVPLVSAAAIAELVAGHEEAGAAATVATAELEDPSGYGRVVRAADGSLEKIVETKNPGDATDGELGIREVNSGIYVFDPEALAAALPQVGSDNAQGERYLPDVLPAIAAAGGKVAVVLSQDPNLLLGVNDRVALARVREVARAMIVERLMLAGADIVDPASTVIDVGVELGEDAVVEPFSVLSGDTAVGPGSRIGPGTTLAGVKVGEGASILRSHLADCEVGDGASVGPFSHVRPGTVIGAGAKVGAFVELKNAEIGEGAKVPHLSYVGDADVGAGANLGAGTITANYDGTSKHRTVFGERVHGGVHVSYVAPVQLGDDVWTAAGTVVTEDVPDGSLAIGRERQLNKEGYDERKRDGDANR
ncbi:MAG: bifunctional UDP-N-acetylglucosamine diphosphorylase/glucosamine-1-phosphate N-acetyltransferase GlmU [Acidobacteria bacterium]|nr:bifunctional UDP-N-acetylglucosamine diphosphorylase/glucosamine-1-phosphate N-acetyltransferase GlmU [Acidobacteriota bacterium]